MIITNNFTLLIISLHFLSIHPNNDQWKEINDIFEQVELVSENVNETIPFYYSPTRHILVDVRINGSKTKYPFLLDSGATTYVFKNMLEQQQLPDIGNGFAIGAGGGMLFPDIYQID